MEEGSKFPGRGERPDRPDGQPPAPVENGFPTNVEEYGELTEAFDEKREYAEEPGSPVDEDEAESEFYNSRELYRENGGTY